MNPKGTRNTVLISSSGPALRHSEAMGTRRLVARTLLRQKMPLGAESAKRNAHIIDSVAV